MLPSGWNIPTRVGSKQWYCAYFKQYTKYRLLSNQKMLSSLYLFLSVILCCAPSGSKSPSLIRTTGLPTMVLEREEGKNNTKIYRTFSPCSAESCSLYHFQCTCIISSLRCMVCWWKTAWIVYLDIFPWQQKYSCMNKGLHLCIPQPVPNCCAL